MFFLRRDWLLGTARVIFDKGCGALGGFREDVGVVFFADTVALLGGCPERPRLRCSLAQVTARALLSSDVLPDGGLPIVLVDGPRCVSPRACYCRSAPQWCRSVLTAEIDDLRRLLGDRLDVVGSFLLSGLFPQVKHPVCREQVRSCAIRRRIHARRNTIWRPLRISGTTGLSSCTTVLRALLRDFGDALDRSARC